MPKSWTVPCMKTQKYSLVQRCHASNTRSTCNCTSTCWRTSRYPTSLSISVHLQEHSHDAYSRAGVRSRSLCPLPTFGNSTSATKPVSYTHLRAHETRHDLVCRLLLEKKKT